MAADTSISLYRETLATALTEFDNLSTKIEQFKMDLDRLEQQRNAVEEICDAIQRWMHRTTNEDAPVPVAVPELDGFPISTEETALIAQVQGTPAVPSLV